MTVQRYDFGTDYRGNTGVPGIIGKVDGRYVLYAAYEGLLAQHHRDSAELRRLCEARDQARKTAEYWKAEHLAGNAEITRLCEALDQVIATDESGPTMFITGSDGRSYPDRNAGGVPAKIARAALAQQERS